MRGGIVLLHGRDSNQDAADLIRPLRLGLPEHGWSTLSLAMPIAVSDNPQGHADLVPEAIARLQSSIDFLKEKKIGTIALLAHDTGTWTVLRYLADTPDSSVKAAVLIDPAPVRELDVPPIFPGSPLSVLRVMAGSDRLHPKPNGPLPEPESYDSESCGPKPKRPGLVAIGTVIEPVPVTGLAANFSPMPRIAPPPLGREMEGAVGSGSPPLRVFAVSAGVIGQPMSFQRTRQAVRAPTACPPNSGLSAAAESRSDVGADAVSSQLRGSGRHRYYLVLLAGIRTDN